MKGELLADKSTSESTSLLAWDLRSNVNICLRGEGICLHDNEQELRLGSLAWGLGALLVHPPHPHLLSFLPPCTCFFMLSLLLSQKITPTCGHACGISRLTKKILDLVFLTAEGARMHWGRWTRDVSWQLFGIFFLDMQIVKGAAPPRTRLSTLFALLVFFSFHVFMPVSLVFGKDKRLSRQRFEKAAAFVDNTSSRLKPGHLADDMSCIH